MRIGIDVGGTNTDAVLMDGTRVVNWYKSPTTPDVSSGIISALEHVLQESQVPNHRILGVMIGTTHFTNAVVERKHVIPVAAVRIGLPATEALPPMVDWPADLRDTLAAIKIASELERVGDLAKNIAKRALVLNREPPVRLTSSLARMGKATLAQLKLVLDAYSDRDAGGAEAVWRQDNEIDEIYNSLFRELLTYMMEDPRTISLCTHLLFVAKNIERCGDHATNIAETVYHMVSGGHLATERPKADVTSSTTIPFERKA